MRLKVVSGSRGGSSARFQNWVRKNNLSYKSNLTVLDSRIRSLAGGGKPSDDVNI